MYLSMIIHLLASIGELTVTVYQLLLGLRWLTFQLVGPMLIVIPIFPLCYLILHPICRLEMHIPGTPHHPLYPGPTRDHESVDTPCTTPRKVSRLDSFIATCRVKRRISFSYVSSFRKKAQSLSTLTSIKNKAQSPS